MTMTNFGMDTYNIYSDKQIVPPLTNEERCFECEPFDFQKVISRTSLFTKLISIFL